MMSSFSYVQFSDSYKNNPCDIKLHQNYKAKFTKEHSLFSPYCFYSTLPFSNDPLYIEVDKYGQ